MGDLTASPVPPDIMERQTLALSRPLPGVVVQEGEAGFKDDMLRLYNPAESNAVEQLVRLKESLNMADTDSFWALLTEGIAHMADAQYAFVSKRILAEDKDVAVEMPPLGETGSCLMGEAFYINDDQGNGPGHFRNFKYHAYQCPCAYMKHDKVFVIPERLNDFIVNNPNELVIPGEAYLGIPLFAEGKCFAHFGVMWGAEGAARRTLSWSFIESLFHGLEDLILKRVLEGSDFAKSAQPVQEEEPKVVPHEAISVAQSLKPYARSLSHELRTPMQGVVGMLDVMMANVKEAGETLNIDIRTRAMLETLKENIEAVQDSSRRAVEAADNVVHAYDMNMGVPEDVRSPLDMTADAWNNFWRERRFNLANTSTNASPIRGTKRRRQDDEDSSSPFTGVRTRVARPVRRRIRESLSEEPLVRGTVSCPPETNAQEMSRLERCVGRCGPTGHLRFASEYARGPTLRNTHLREVLQYVVNDALKVGGRPDSAIAEATETGEKIEVRSRGSNGEASIKLLEWSVSPDVPDTILIDEKDLAKVISCVTLNAIKFTHNGSIALDATLSTKGRYVVISIKDTGSGIPAAFLPNLFKPFSQQDHSTTRQSEGLGLGLMVAKGLARKLGGDLFCIRSHVYGPKKGSEFELRVPLTAGEVCSRPASPFGSPTPSLKARMSVENDSPMAVYHAPITPPLASDTFKTEMAQTLPVSILDTPSIAVHPTTPTHGFGLVSPRRTSSPLRRSEVPKAAPSPSTPAMKLADEIPLNILVVDDNAINRRVLVNMLNRLGYKNVATAYNGNDAVDAMQRNATALPAEAIDVILMDLWMPLLDGFQATEKILQMPELADRRQPTVLAVTADVTDAALEKAENCGMKGYVTKPFVTRDIVRLIRKYCKSESA